MTVALASLSSFDGGVRETVRLARPDRYRDLLLPASAGPRSCRGGGYSYAPASFGGGALAVDQTRFDRLLAFDEGTGEVECEAGATLGALHAFLGPRGFFLPVQPGYPGITIGGCIAADVHGKNQYRDGTFRSHVASLRLFHPRHGEVEASGTANAEAFDLTCGGLGLTGAILSARLRAARLPSAAITMERRPLASLSSALEALEEAAATSDFLYTDHDVTRRGAAFGRGVLVSGRFARGEEGPRDGSAGRWVRMTAESRGAAVPPLLNRWTAVPFDRVVAAAQGLGPSRSRSRVFDFLFPVARKAAYFHLFGRRGFHELQWIVPAPRVPDLLRELPRLLARRSAPVTLASCKLFRGTPSLVRFDGAGLCLALDFPRDGSSPAFAAELDRLGTDVGALPNLAKDSRLPRDVARAGLAGFDDFRERLRRFDPDRLYRSALSERLGL